MSAELKILRLFCLDRDKFDTYNRHVLTTHNVEREHKILLDLIRRYYEKYDSDHITKEELRTFFELTYPAERNKRIYYDQIDMIHEQEINPDLIHDLVLQSLEQHFAADIVNTLLPCMEGNSVGVMAEVEEKLLEYKHKAEVDFSEDRLTPCRMSVAELIEQEIDATGLAFPLPTLNATIGGAKRKTLGLLYAYVDSGKTSMGMFFAQHFAKQIKDRENESIVYAGNEEAKSRLSLRATSAITGMSRLEIKDDPERADRLRTANGFDKILLVDGVQEIRDVRFLLDSYKPRVLFLDQATKVIDEKGRGVRADREVEAVRKLFNKYRELAKEYNTTIIGISQGTGEAENKKWLKLSDIYGSRVAIQGELDWALGIGRMADNDNLDTIRYLNIPKNKLLDGEGRKFTVEFNRYISTYKEN